MKCDFQAILIPVWIGDFACDDLLGEGLISGSYKQKLCSQSSRTFHISVSVFWLSPPIFRTARHTNESPHKELTLWKRSWCWEGLKAGGEGNNRGWDGWMASPTKWTCVWVNSGSWCWTGRPGMVQSIGSQRVRHNRATELNWNIGIMDFKATSVLL